jgi:hypothetical protein
MGLGDLASDVCDERGRIGRFLDLCDHGDAFLTGALERERRAAPGRTAG